MKIDILAIVAHPDDVEMSFGGTMIKHQKMGYSTGVIDLTRGELGTRGTPAIRAAEAEKAAEIMKLSVRDNLGFADGFFENTKENQLNIVEQIRKYKPEIIITNAIYDRHPDHIRSSEIVERSCFLSGLKAIETFENGKPQEPHRPTRLYFSIQSIAQNPDLLIDVSDSIEERRLAINAFRSQFYNPESDEPETYISSENFMNMLEGRSVEFGMRIGAKYAEGFRVKSTLGAHSLFDLI